MERRVWLIGVAALAAVPALGYLGWTGIHSGEAAECFACRRPIHAHSKTVAVAHGRSRVFCCPTCALSEHQQEGKPVKVTELTSFLTGAPLDPADAYIVRGSNFNMCARTRELVNADKHPAVLHYDRCAPSLIAFARRDEAVRFARDHGGEVMRFPEVAAAFAK